MPKAVRILLTGGGSGGHILPNLAVASAIKNKEPGTQLLYLASRGKLDANLLESTGIPFHQIFSGKWRRYFSWRNLVDPFLLFIGFFQSLYYLLKFRPQVVFSKGGFASLPVVLAAFALKCPVILHESDSRMGLANQIASKLADTVCVSFPEMAHVNKNYRFTGNPIRGDILTGDRQKGYEFTHFTPEMPVLFVWGGSQGSAQINQLVEAEFDRLVEHFQVVHITGGSIINPRKHPHYVSFAYLDLELKHVYTITDLVIGRAGANSLFELAALQKPNIIVPLLNADQLGNADYFERKGAAIVYQKDQSILDLAWELWEDKERQQKMKEVLKAVSQTDASDKIADIVFSTVNILHP